jgi:hypothetical protein
MARYTFAATKMKATKMKPECAKKKIITSKNELE